MEESISMLYICRINLCMFEMFLMKSIFQKIFFFSFRLPWNQHTLIGWMVETIFYLNSASTFLFVNAVFLTFFITICEYHSAFYELFRSEIERMNGMIELDQNVKRIICDSIKLHAAAKK